MARYTTAIATPWPSQKAFSYMADVSRFIEWDPSVKKSVRVSGDGTGVGTTYEVTVKAGGTAVIPYEMKEYDSPHRFLLYGKTSFFTSLDEVRIEPAGTGSIVTYHALLTLNGIWGWFDPFLQIAFNRLGGRAAAGLLRVLQGTKVQ